MSIAIMSWNNGKGARELSRAVTRKGRLLYRDSSRPIVQSTVLNMGLKSNRRLEDYISRGGNLINYPAAVATCSNKLYTLEALRGTPYCLEYTTDWYRPIQWTEEGHDVVARHVLNGHSGEGITIIPAFSRWGDEVEAPLFTKYFKKTAEYRVHCSPHTIVDVRRKAKRRGHVLEGQGTHVWNHSAGFVYKIEGVTPDTVPASVLHAAQTAVYNTGMGLAAVDLGYDADTDQVKVFEVNSAPGLTGSTVKWYTEYLLMVDGKRNDFIDWEIR